MTKYQTEHLVKCPRCGSNHYVTAGAWMPSRYVLCPACQPVAATQGEGTP